MNICEELIPSLFVEAGRLRSAALTGLRRDAPTGEAADSVSFHRVDVKPILLKDSPHFQFTYRFRDRVTHRNLDPTAAATHAAELLTARFSQALFRAADAEYHLTRGKSGNWSSRRQVSATAAPAEVGDHNRHKNYLLPEGALPIPFLIRLGVMTSDGRIVAAKYDKFRQINRFLELVADTLEALPTDRVLRIVDFGSGKSYLTFALYHFLHIVKGLDVGIVGLDRKRDVIEGCDTIAADLGWGDGLRFEVGDIGGYGSASETADMVVSLHACDTATDDALAKAVGWGASVILCVPCCQHELFKKIESEPLRPLLKHGILRERLASLVTDALRAETLEQHGYHVQVLEFIDLEHTPKNLLIRAVRRQTADPAHDRRIAAEYGVFRDFWGIDPYIDSVFGRQKSSE